MPDFLRSVLAQKEAITASTVITYDLPVNPLSAIFLTFAWRDGSALGNAGDPVADLLSFLQKIEVLYKGQAIISASGADLAFMATRLLRRPLAMVNLVDAAAEEHWLTIPITFGRRAYDPKYAFPASKRGELQLQITYPAAVGTVDSPKALIETVELFDTTPSHYLKYTTISKTPSAAGEHDVDLPIGHRILGIGFFATQVPTGVLASRDIDWFKLLVDNSETRYSKSNWESFWTEDQIIQGYDPVQQRHTHAQAANTDVVTGMQLYGIVGPARYAFIDLDPLGDETYVLDTAGRSRVHLHINANTTFTAIRILPVEILPATT